MAEPTSSLGSPPGGLTGNGLGRVAGALFRPRETFEAIAARPTWLAPLLVIVVLSVASAALWVPHIDVEDLVRSRVAGSGQAVPAERLDEAVEFTSRLRWVMFLGPVLVFQPLLLAVAAAVFYLLFKILGSEQRYLQSLAVVTHAFLPLAVAALLSIPLLLGVESITTEEVMSGGVLASSLAFLAPEDASPAVRALLQSVDFFSLWTVLLLVIGYRRSTRLANPTVAACVMVLWGLWILGRVGIAAIAA